MKKRIITPLVGALLFAQLVGCSTPKKWEANRELLTSGLGSFEAEKYGETARAMDTLLVQTNGTAKDRETYALQRYYAAFMTARAHIEASFGPAFLKEKGSSFSFGSSGDSSAPSYVGHLTAAKYHAGYVSGWYESAEKKPARIGEGEGATPLLPPALESFGLENTRLNMVLSLVAATTRLQFQDRVNSVIENYPYLLALKSCEESIEKAQVSANVRPWVYRGVFGYMVTLPGREPEAFRFAVRALETGNGAKDSITETELFPLRDWISNNGQFEFRCPRDNSLTDPTDVICPVCFQSYLDFTPTAIEAK